MPISSQQGYIEKRKAPARKPAKTKGTGEQVKIGAETLEDLVNLASESSILRSRVEQQVNTLRGNLDEMSSTIDRLRTQLRSMEIETDAQIQYRQEIIGPDESEFDPLEMDRYTRQQELTRGLSESSNDLQNLQDNFEHLTGETEALLLQQGRINTELQERLIDTRMIPFDSLVPRLQRMARQIGKELNKSIEISIHADGEMDRTVLEKMISPIEHMLRNAIDHGIESASVRKNLDKKKQGRIKIRLTREGAQVVISISDDGAGIDLNAVRAKALERGVISEGKELADKDLIKLIFSSGFSTAEKVTQISGRGVGMDVVFNDIKKLGGYIDVESTLGKGSQFIVRLPFTVSVNNALMVVIQDESYAIPLTNIEGIVTVSPYELEELYRLDEPVYEYAGISYELNYLGTMLEHFRLPDFEGVVKPVPVLLLHGVDKPVAVQLDSLVGSREVVVKSLGAQLSSISGLSGATILGDGSVVLILDIPSLWRRLLSRNDEDLEELVEYEEEYIPTVMVVDDSITVRKVTSRLLERNHFNVLTAKDGIDASTQLQDVHPDIILLDIEMPRMDGFELATIIRSEQELKDIPIIMITSRSGEKHKERAMSIGVNDYMGKPFGEAKLLSRIGQLIDIGTKD
ncbi:MAG: hybrid sensor histidine kinase/response regulator [Gammaproteobacteria bacterium]|nr:hybrid sensor histidine kinase/response regulator [Gammaproteobacteria bacterium]